MSTADQPSSPWTGELASDRKYGMLIGGKLVDGADGQTFQCEYPFTGQKWGAVPQATAGDVDHAVNAAHDAFDGWSRTRPIERAQSGVLVTVMQKVPLSKLRKYQA